MGCSALHLYIFRLFGEDFYICCSIGYAARVGSLAAGVTRQAEDACFTGCLGLESQQTRVAFCISFLRNSSGAFRSSAGPDGTLALCDFRAPNASASPSPQATGQYLRGSSLFHQPRPQPSHAGSSRKAPPLISVPAVSPGPGPGI